MLMRRKKMENKEDGQYFIIINGGELTDVVNYKHAEGKLNHYNSLRLRKLRFAFYVVFSRKFRRRLKYTLAYALAYSDYARGRGSAAVMLFESLKEFDKIWTRKTIKNN